MTGRSGASSAAAAGRMPSATRSTSSRLYFSRPSSLWSTGVPSGFVPNVTFRATYFRTYQKTSGKSRWRDWSEAKAFFSPSGVCCPARRRSTIFCVAWKRIVCRCCDS